jgi:hypothetical protein
MKGGGDGRLRRLTNFFIEALFYSERADRGLSRPDGDPDDIDDPEECNESIEVAKKNIMKSRERYGPAIPGLTKKGMEIYIDKITTHFNDLYSDDLTQYPRVEDDIVAKFVKESIDESSVAGAGKSKKKKGKLKKDLVPYANEVEEAAYFLSLNNEGKGNRKDKKDKELKRKRTKGQQVKRTKKGKEDKEKDKKDKRSKREKQRKRTKREKQRKRSKREQGKRTRRLKRSGDGKCRGLDEEDCKSNSRCNWNMFEIRDFDMNTSKGREKLFDLKESLMKTYTKEELMEYLGSEDPSFYQVYMRAKKEYDNGLRGLCGHKMFRGSELSDLLKKRVERDYPELRKKTKKKTKIQQKDLAEDLLKKAMEKSKPDKEIQSIIDQFGLHEKDLQRIYEKNNKQFSKLDKFLAPDHDEVSSLLGMVEDEVELDNRNKKSGKYKKPKKTKKAKKKAKK